MKSHQKILIDLRLHKEITLRSDEDLCYKIFLESPDKKIFYSHLRSFENLYRETDPGCSK